MLADEENSSDATNNYANLDHTQVYNNILAGCRIAIRDYSEGDAHAVGQHAFLNLEAGKILSVGDGVVQCAEGAVRFGPPVSMVQQLDQHSSHGR